MALADRFFRVWHFEGAGDFSSRRAEKEEFELRVADLLGSHTRPEFVAIARNDPAPLRGSTHRGPYTFNPDTDDLRVVAVRMLKVQMAIDPHRVIKADEIQDVGLFDYWWGLKLTREDLDDVHPTGTTVHARAPGSEVDHTYPLLSTSFRWRANGTLKELEVQEAVPADSWEHSGSEFVINRYAHSIRDTTQKAFVHLDGAAKAFPKSEYALSAEDPNAATGTPLYRKLFRLDGDLTDELWGCVLSHFFRGNEHIHEYFGAILDERPQAAVA